MGRLIFLPADQVHCRALVRTGCRCPGGRTGLPSGLARFGCARHICSQMLVIFIRFSSFSCCFLQFIRYKNANSQKASVKKIS